MENMYNDKGLKRDLEIQFLDEKTEELLIEMRELQCRKETVEKEILDLREEITSHEEKKKQLREDKRSIVGDIFTLLFCIVVMIFVVNMITIMPLLLFLSGVACVVVFSLKTLEIITDSIIMKKQKNELDNYSVSDTEEKIKEKEKELSKCTERIEKLSIDIANVSENNSYTNELDTIGAEIRRLRDIQELLQLIPCEEKTEESKGMARKRVTEC